MAVCGLRLEQEAVGGLQPLTMLQHFEKGQLPRAPYVLFDTYCTEVGVFARNLTAPSRDDCYG